MGANEILANTVLPVEQSDFLCNLPAYTAGISDRLEITKALFEANAYYPCAFAWPIGNTDPYLLFQELETKEGSLQVPVGSYLWGITAKKLQVFYETAVPANIVNVYNSNFSFGITDKGSGLGFTERDVSAAWPISGAGNQSPYLSGGDDIVTLQISDGESYGPLLLSAPIIVTKPGQIGVKITNRTNVALANHTLLYCVIQIALHFAVPINNVSLNTPQIKPA